jgi:hypothetical protein
MMLIVNLGKNLLEYWEALFLGLNWFLRKGEGHAEINFRMNSILKTLLIILAK